MWGGCITEVTLIARLSCIIESTNRCPQHTEASTLYVQEVDLGEEKPRTVVSGLAQVVPLDALKGRLGVFLCNLKPRTIQGTASHAMLLCAAQ